MMTEGMAPPIEIERKFLLNTSLATVLTHYEQQTASSLRHDLITQVYMPDSGGWAIRARSIMPMSEHHGTEFFLTLKRRQTEITQTEIEKRLHAMEFDHLLRWAKHKPLVKRRHYLPEDGWTLDEFLNPEFECRAINDDPNLVIAEIELEHEHQTIDPLWWLGNELHPNWSNRDLAQALIPG